MKINCKICNNIIPIFQSGIILKKYRINYFHCEVCGYIQTEKPYWLSEAYKNPINLSDTGLVSRNIYFSQKVASILYFFFDKTGQYLDYAGGYGIFTRLMRDYGFDYYSYDPYCENLVARGFEGDISNKYKLVTAFEVFEHFENPIVELEKLLAMSDSILFSTETYLYNPPNLNDWWYYGLEHGQHVGIYSYKTLKYLANKYNLNLYTNKKSFHLITKRKINRILFFIITKLSNHGLFSIVKRNLISKTQTDRLSLKVEY